MFFFIQAFKIAFKQLKKAVFFPFCTVCYRYLDTHNFLCPTCWGKIKFIRSPCCYICGKKLSIPTFGKTILCASCIESPPSYDMGRSAVVYSDIVSKLILRLKYSDGMEYVKVFAQWLTMAYPSMFQEADCIVPVPIHWKRSLSRKYNQTLVLAMALREITGLPIYHNVLRRKTFLRPQKGLTESQRKENVKNAFTIGNVSHVAERKVILLDDVFTTGATLEICSKLLKKSRVQKVYALTVARSS